MSRKGKLIRRIIFKCLSFKQYLFILSNFYFILYKLKILKLIDQYKYHYFISNLINKGDTVIDIGANLGYFSKNFSSWVGINGKVHSVEPVKDVLEVFKINIRKRKNIIIYPYALGEEEKTIYLGNVTMNNQGYIGSGSHFVLNNFDQENKNIIKFPAEMKRASKLFNSIEKINFIKIDIEGYETVVIPEMENLIIKHKPLMLIETKGENRKVIISFFNSRGFKTFVLTGRKLYNSTEINTDKEDDIIVIHDTLINKYLKYIAY